MALIYLTFIAKYGAIRVDIPLYKHLFSLQITKKIFIQFEDTGDNICILLA